MPHENGIDFFRRIRKIDSMIALILFSGYTQEKYLLDIVTLKLDGYMMKPITSKKLDDMLQSILNKRPRELHSICAEKQIVYSYLSKMMTCKGQAISLTHLEILLLELFLSAPQYTLGHDVIAWELYNGEAEVKNRIKNLIKRLRIKVPFLKIRPIIDYGYQLTCAEGKSHA